MSVEKFFAAIRDSGWHSIDGLSDQLGIPTGNLVEFSNFLSDRGFLKYDDKGNRIRIAPLWRLLLPEEGELLEPKTILASFIIPPETSINVQSTHISNLTGIELVIDLHINKKIKELTIRT